MLSRHLASHQGHIQLPSHNSPTHPAGPVHLHLDRDLQDTHVLTASWVQTSACILDQAHVGRAHVDSQAKNGEGCRS